jgi:hypothetical protein
MRARSIPLSLTRRFIADLCHTRQGVPLGVVRSTINVAAVRDARRAAAVQIPWTILFARAYALVARTTPELRQAYVRLPSPRLSESESSVASIMIERDWNGAVALFPARLKRPEDRSLIELAAELETMLTAPVEMIHHFKVIMRLSRWPWPVRRLLWWLAHNVGAWRPGYFGTFGISTLGAFGVTVNVPVSPLTNFVSYGPIAANGDVELLMGFDHRVMDGALIARTMRDLGEALNGPIVAELRAIGTRA